jgi:hypothetical protein
MEYLNGYLTSNQDTKSLITVIVHAGSAEITPRSERTFEPEPSEPPDPLAPPAAPSAPPARQP